MPVTFTPQKPRLTVAADGAYNGFPVLAYDGGVLLGAYRRSARHIAASGGTANVVRSRDEGASWLRVSIQSSYMSSTGTWEVSPTGLAVIPARGGRPRVWVMQRLHRRFDESIARRCDIVTSTNDGVTWSAPQRIDFPGCPNPFSSDLIWQDDGTRDGILYQAQYGSQSERGRVRWEPQFLKSTDRGATWTESLGHVVPDSWVDNVSASAQRHTSEPKLLVLPDGRLLCTMRWDKWSTGTGHTANSLLSSTYDPASQTWTTPTQVILEGNGMPSTLMVDGTVLLLVRDFVNTTNALGKWGWALSTDNGASFVRQLPDWAGYKETTGTTYGSPVRLPNGDVGVLWGAETRPYTALGDASNLYYSRLTVTNPDVAPVPGTEPEATWGGVEVDPYATPPQVRIRTTADRVTRRRTDTGEQVTVRGAAVDGVLVDYDVPQGAPVSYVAAHRGTIIGSATVEMPESQPWLIPATRPDLAVQLIVEKTGYGDGIELPATESVLEIPGGAPYVVQTGYGAARGSVTLLAHTVAEWEQLRAALTVLGPKMLSLPLSHWPLHGQVEWVTTGTVKATPLHWRNPGWRVTVDFVPARRPLTGPGEEQYEAGSWARLVGMSWADLLGKSWADLVEGNA